MSTVGHKGHMQPMVTYNRDFLYIPVKVLD
jgi:hypothetical protein